MATTKYGHLVKKLNSQKGPAGTMVWLMGKDLEGLSLNFIWGYVNVAGEWTLGRTGGHMHPYGECFILAGLDYKHPNDLGAEIEVAMGDEGEIHTIDKTTVVISPAGFAHNLVATRRLDRPYGCLIISLSDEHKSIDLPERISPLPTGDKYAHLVKKLEMRDTQRKEGGNADYIAGWNGKDMEGFELNFTWAFHTGLGAWHKQDPHVHPSDEALLFVGLDPDNPGYLGAEIEIAMGEEQEKHIFDTPTVVIAPGGFVHCPLITRKVEKPYGFSAISLSTGHDTKWLGKG
jgi:hypothetical protein